MIDMFLIQIMAVKSKNTMNGPYNLVLSDTFFMLILYCLFIHFVATMTVRFQRNEGDISHNIIKFHNLGELI